MQSIAELFTNRIFRIPDYQRGYSWKNDELDDLWEDLMNLQANRDHYTGMITLNEIGSEKLKKWKPEDWLINGQNYTPYYLVDGQQRLTTIIILLHALMRNLDSEHDNYAGVTKADIAKKYFYTKSKSKNLTCYLFGYEVDDPSYEYLKTKIFQQLSVSSYYPETSYTYNLDYCNKFFDKKLHELPHQEREVLFKKITTQLKFDIKELQDSLDIFIVFETMNNRGKELSNLEKLKNRFIYLSTLLTIKKSNEVIQLRNDINNVWKKCYENLGKNKSNQLSDDIFLRNHFILYHYFNKEKGFPFHQIFKEIYTVHNTVHQTKDTNYKEIKNYLQSIHDASIKWYIINNPEHAFVNNLISIAESSWLVKLNRLGFRIFGPLILATYLTINNESQRIRFLNRLETFIFLIYMCAGRRSTLGNTEFSNLANDLFKSKISLSDVIDLLDSYIQREYSSAHFLNTIKDQFSGSKKNGYYDWPGTRYLLFEYDEYIRGKENSKVSWEKPNSIEHIFPQSAHHPSWRQSFVGFSPKQQKTLCNSLGNLVLLSHSKNSELSNRPFKEKRKTEHKSGNYSGYINGSHSEVEVSQYKNWNGRAIYLRGIKILNFFNKRWATSLSKRDMKELILIDDSLQKKIR